MKKHITIRIYFEYGQKIKNLSFWNRMKAGDFASELIKKAKAFDLAQALNFNVSKGYFENGQVHWGVNEVKHFKHPHVVELTDTEERIDLFLQEQNLLLEETKIVLVKSEVELKSRKDEL